MGQNRKKLRKNSHLIIHFPTSEGVSKVSERANEWAQRRARAKRAVRSERTSERCEQTSKRTSKWPSTSVCILGCSGSQCIDTNIGRISFTWSLTSKLSISFPTAYPTAVVVNVAESFMSNKEDGVIRYFSWLDTRQSDKQVEFWQQKGIKI